MRLHFAHLCDYAVILNGGRLLVSGISRGSMVQKVTNGITVPHITPCVMAIEIFAGPGESGLHEFSMTLLDAAVEQRLGSFAVPFQTIEPHPDNPTKESAAFLIQPINAIPVPAFGKYVWELKVDGTTIGELPIHVMLAPDGPPPPAP